MCLLCCGTEIQWCPANWSSRMPASMVCKQKISSVCRHFFCVWLKAETSARRLQTHSNCLLKAHQGTE